MRLVALTAAAALLGTGCFVSTTDTFPPGPVGDANVFWSFLRSAPASPGGFVEYDASLASVNAQGICPQSDVDTVRVTSAAGTRDVACTGPIPGGGYSQGITIANLPAGPNAVTLTGYRGSLAAYRASFTVNVVANATVDRVVALDGVSADLEVFAYLSERSTGFDYLTCAEAFSPNISVTLHDSFGTLVADDLVGCVGPLPVITFSGFVDVDSYTVRMQGFAVPGGALVFDSCDQPLNHFTTQVGGQGFAAVLETNPVPACP